ncbi:hypothetical protein H206_06105 [Candidatus Electrothrix aarhusensis]|uniref:Uncharacterized protein n=1 Tax=Candidatus Electrothrix aarhusensis TaxID=1859131 RepID=A0A444J3D7_9BACT|nr:hypothetical protein H206_06105 [Candidatus Electrothrix aarhusensis]
MSSQLPCSKSCPLKRNKTSCLFQTNKVDLSLADMKAQGVQIIMHTLSLFVL